MAQDDARASRIKELKELHPEVTFRQIADHVGVSERSANEWAAKGTVSYDNARKLTEFFRERGHPDLEDDYIWRGPMGEAPDLIGSLTSPQAGVAAQLVQINERLTRIEATLALIAQQTPAPTGKKRESVEAMLEGIWGQLADKPAPVNT